MVLQNRYKARASARYNAERGGRGRGATDGQGRGRGRGSGRGRGGGAGWRGGGDDDDDDDQEYEEADKTGDGDGEGEDEDENSEDTAFPSLQASAQAHHSAASTSRREDRVPSKYAKRRLESNAWRYKQDEKEDGPDAEPEPEVDLSALFARVAKLDSSKNAVITIGASQSSSQTDAETVETAEEIEADIDHSLAYLYERERARERARTGRANQDTGGSHVIAVASMTAEERSKMEKEAEEMKADKEKADALRALKERFQGRAVGERAKVSNIRRLVSQHPPSESKPDTRPKPAHLQPERDRLPSHAKTWASARGEDADGPQGKSSDDLFFDEVVVGPAAAAASPLATNQGLRKGVGVVKGSVPPSSAQRDTKEMEDFLDAMLG